MTPETRETLEQMFEYARARAEWHPSLMSVTDPGWDEDDLAECVEDMARWGRRALALRDALTERTCGTCHYSDGDTAATPNVWCSNEQVGLRLVPREECCTRWQAREGERGGR